MSTNTNPETGIAYGYISANYLDPDVVDELLMGSGCTEFKNLSYDTYMEECLSDYRRENEERLDAMDPDDRAEQLELAEQEFADAFEDGELVVEGVKEDVHYASSWLGGALNFFIFQSPHRTDCGGRASPCVPGAGILDHHDGDVHCYDVPPDWRRDPQWRMEFPDFDMDVSIPPEWEDDSYIKEGCPSFWALNTVKVYVDYKDPEKREGGDAQLRFRVFDTAGEDERGYETDDWEDVLRMVENLRIQKD